MPITETVAKWFRFLAKWFRFPDEPRDDSDILADTLQSFGISREHSFNFKCNSRQCTDISDYLDAMATSLHLQFSGDELERRRRIRMMCEPAVKELCNAIVDAKLFLHDCSVKAGFGQTIESIIKLDTREAYEVLLQNLIWSKAGLDVAILYAEAADHNNPNLDCMQTIKKRVDECMLQLSGYSRMATQPRLNRDRDKLYCSVEKPPRQDHLQLIYSDEAQKKCLSFLVAKSQAHQKFSQVDMYGSEGGNAHVKGQLDRFRIDPSDLLYDGKENFLGVGSYGEVYRYCWLGQSVAVKVFRGLMGQNEVFEREAFLLAHLQNPFIVHMVGWCEKGADCAMLVMKLADTDLQKVIDKSGETLLIHAAVDIMLQVSKGMEYLHERRVIHRDIKPGNVLLEHGSVKTMAAKGYARVKLCDFGLAKVKQLSAKDRSLFTTLKQGTSYYRAPEVLLDDDEIPAKYTRKADVFSFGVTCSEILAGRSATSCYTKLSTTKELRRSMLENVRPSLPSDCPSHLADLIRRCWDTDPKCRPPFTRISSTLTYIKFILMRVSDVQRVRPYNSVVSPFDEEELSRRVSSDEGTNLEGTAEGKRYTGFRSEEEDEKSYEKPESSDSFDIVRQLEGQKGTAPSYTPIMRSGESLQTNQCIMCNGYKFVMQEKGMLVLYAPGRQQRAVWASHTFRADDCTCVLEDDGNLIIYDSKGRHPNNVVWSSNSDHSARARISAGVGRYMLELDESGPRAVIRRSPDGTLVWATDESVERTSIKSGQFLAGHQWMLSQGHRLIMQGDGNLVLYDEVSPNRLVVWASHTQCAQEAVCVCKLEDDGNLVIYDTSSMTVVWSSMKSGYEGMTGPHELELDGNLAVIRDPQRQIIWATS